MKVKISALKLVCLNSEYSFLKGLEDIDPTVPKLINIDSSLDEEQDINVR